MKGTFFMRVSMLLTALILPGVAVAGQDPAHSDNPPEETEPIPPCVVEFPEGAERDAFIVQTWPDGIVPYEFNENVNNLNRQRTRAAMQEIMDVCRVRFVPRTNQPDYLVIRDSTGNSAALGWQGGPQSVRVTSWQYRFIIVHELMHALGDNHEHQRPDRDEYIIINEENVEPGRLHNFELRPLAAPTIWYYDFDSVMHYGLWAFSANGKPTITIRPEHDNFPGIVGQITHLSEGDILGLQARYGEPLAADLSLDGRVNDVDLSILIAAWGESGVDLDDDGVCGPFDLAMLLAEWDNSE